MKRINGKIKDEKLDLYTIWDEPSINGFPTKNSIVLTVLHEIVDGINYIGVAMKMPNDEPIPRIGKAIAYRNLHQYRYTVDKVDIPLLILETFRFHDSINKKINNKLKKRMLDMFYQSFTEETLNERGDLLNG